VVAPRVVADVTLDVAGLDEPATGRLIGVPADRRPALNDVVLSRGRWIEPGRPDEILASEGFVTANRLNPGDTIGALINGRFRRLAIVGVALSPEYVYSVRPGELVPDDRRFGILWMNERALSTAMDMEGAFNDVSLAVARGAALDEVMARLDPLLQPFGGRGAMPRAIQISHWTLENELTLLQEVGVLLPLIFLGVAALVLNVALVRMLALQRQQIAALKALGYGNAAIGWHYIKWALVIGLAGVAIGIGSGMVLAQALLDTYNVLFRFPELRFVLPLPVIATVTVLTMLATVAGAASAVARAVRIAPAEAMRPAAPLMYGRSLLELPALARRLSGTARMVLRNISRFPARTLASVMGISLAVAIMMIGLVFGDAIEQLIATQFWVAARQDVTVNFVEPRSAGVRHELARLPGVLAVEPQRVVAARIRFGHRERHLAVTGVTAGSRLRQIVNRDRSAIALPASGVVLSQPLATALGAVTGDEVIVDVLEGARPTHHATVTAVVDDLIGLSVYMDLDRLHDLMREGDSVSGALLAVDGAQAAGLSAALKQLPAVAGVGFKRAELAGFRDTMAAALDLTITVNVLFAGIIAFGVVYNAARISLSERARELASLRVLGFTRAEIKSVLLGELSLLTLAALPAGAALGYVLAGGIIASLDSEVYRVPFHVSRQTVASSCLSVIAAAVFSGLLVARRLDTLDLAGVLSIRD
jgi:putative ABC transport system permease protein